MDIINEIGLAAVLEQLAEEGAEMSHAALKMARILRGNNPTPVDWDTAKVNLCEEITDVRLCMDLLKSKCIVFPDPDLLTRKLERWEQRILERKEMDHHDKN